MNRMRALAAVSAFLILAVVSPAGAQAAAKGGDTTPTYTTNGWSYRP